MFAARGRLHDWSAPCPAPPKDFHEPIPSPRLEGRLSDTLRIGRALARSVHFRGLSADCIATLAASGRVRRYRDGALVHAPGLPRSALLVVLDGSLRVSCVSTQGRERTLAVLEPGSFHNIQAALGTPDTQAEVHAFGATEVAAFAKASLAHAAREHAELDGHFKRIAVDRIATLITLYSDLTSAPLERRLARRLLAQSMTSAREVTTPIELHVTHAMLAGMLRTSRSRVSGTLEAWERRAVVTIGYRALVVEDVRGLRKIAGSGVRPL